VVFASSYGFASRLSCRGRLRRPLCSKCLLALHLAGHGGGTTADLQIRRRHTGWTQADPLSNPKLHDLLRNDVAYAGHPCHRLSESSPVLEWRLFGTAEPRIWMASATGTDSSATVRRWGFAYVLGRRGLEALAYAFVTHQERFWLNRHQSLFEDATVGLVSMQMAGNWIDRPLAFRSPLDSTSKRQSDASLISHPVGIGSKRSGSKAAPESPWRPATRL